MAHGSIGVHQRLTSAGMRRDKASRTCYRRYNSGREFRWQFT